jgi:Domain of unknown function (DUF6602)
MTDAGDRQRRYGTVGWEEFLSQKRDILRVYDRAVEQNKNRPVRTEQGNVAEGKLREWLAEFLPRRFGVTSGFIIPDARSRVYKLLHFDTIVYDALSAPVLWVSNNPDQSAQGRARAIPAEAVRSVGEIKASFTRTSVADARSKLEELQSLAGFLKPPFCSFILFLEVQSPEQPARIANLLADTSIPGYVGGLILRAKGLDENLSGHFDFPVGERPMDLDSMPLAREPSEPLFDEAGNLQLSKQGDVATYFAADNKWHIDIGYSPVLHDVQLLWSYNSFPRFSFELLERVSGQHDPRRSPTSYGTSWITIPRPQVNNNAG